MIFLAGGWNDALLVEEGDQDEYLKLMTMYTILLSQAADEPIIMAFDEDDEAREANQTESDDRIEIIIEENKSVHFQCFEIPSFNCVL